MAAPDCIFCQIIAGKLPAKVVYEDDHTLAFLDINPLSRGHTLVVPKAHSTDIFDTEDATLGALAVSTKKVAAVVRQAMNAPAVNLLNANGSMAGQTVFHLHLHIVPRYQGDGLRAVGMHATGASKYTETNAEGVQQAIQTAFGSVK